MNKPSSLFQKLHHYLAPPGQGVITIHTAQEKKRILSQKIWATSSQDKIEKKFHSHLKKILTNKRPLLLGICSDNGGGILRGANWGPLALREQFYLNSGSNLVKELFELGDIRVVPHLLHDKYLNPQTIKEVRRALYKRSHLPLAVSPLSIAEEVTRIIYQLNPQAFLIGLGGDHSVAYPLIKGYLNHQSKQKKLARTAVLHFDAHTDLLKSRLGIDLCFGSWASHIIAHLHHPSHLVQLGIRSSGHDRNHWENKFGIGQIWAKEIKKSGPIKIATKIKNYLQNLGVDQIYITFDIDVLDKKIAAKTGTPEDNGLAPHEIALMIQSWKPHFQIGGLDIVEVAPYIDPRDQENTEKDATLLSAQIILDQILDWRKGLD